jgi:hypothetical protein
MIEIGPHDGVEQGYEMVDMLVTTSCMCSTLEKREEDGVRSKPKGKGVMIAAIRVLSWPPG